MRACLLLLVPVAFLAGCSSNEGAPSGRVPIRLGELGIPVSGVARAYMQSDRTGAFLQGDVGGENLDRWSIGGAEVLRGFRVDVPGGALTAAGLDSARIFPNETVRYYRGGASVSVAGIEHAGEPGLHAFVVSVTVPAAGRVALSLMPGPGAPSGAGGRIWSWRTSAGLSLFAYAGEGGSAGREGISCDAAGNAARFLLCAAPSGAGPEAARLVYGGIDTLLAARARRMEGLLNASFFRTSDDTLDEAVRWMTLTLDALMVEGADTFAVAGLPWDGSIDARENAGSIAGLGLATGRTRRTASILRTLARYQDTLRGSPSAGRIPDRVVKGHPSYGGADVTPAFVRELYEQVVNTDDTVLLRTLYPAVVRSIDGTLAHHVDRNNLLVHGARETWMKDVDRGNRAVEVESGWYFQQLIGRFIASYLDDSSASRRWEGLAEKTARSFTQFFVDTVHHTLADHLRPDGARVMEVRPNAMMCLESLDDETMRHGVTREAVTALCTPLGVRTLGSAGSRTGHPPPGRSVYDGPVWTWLTGPLTYAVTRYDRQDVTFPLASGLASLALRDDMAGALPAMRDPAPAGKRASLGAMAEFIRSVYQDYLGARVDMPAGTIVLQPKLPASLTLVQFTLNAGGAPLEVEYRTGAESARLYLNAPALPREMKVNVIWMMPGGDAWRLSFRLKGGLPVAVVAGDDDAVIYRGESRADFEGKRKLRGFSQRAEAADLTPGP
ncbi:MAG TPA: amylo-alpha-1,6-glucosidase [Bacteroidota bacterium]|nr:amylo-alpha-1,6-glucosidase [Bacteroidota bacterium]